VLNLDWFLYILQYHWKLLYSLRVHNKQTTNRGRYTGILWLVRTSI